LRHVGWPATFLSRGFVLRLGGEYLEYAEAPVGSKGEPAGSWSRPATARATASSLVVRSGRGGRIQPVAARVTPFRAVGQIASNDFSIGILRIENISEKFAVRGQLLLLNHSPGIIVAVIQRPFSRGLLCKHNASNHGQRKTEYQHLLCKLGTPYGGVCGSSHDHCSCRGWFGWTKSMRLAAVYDMTTLRNAATPNHTDWTSACRIYFRFSTSRLTADEW
jgi:hypothetical protein